MTAAATIAAFSALRGALAVALVLHAAADRFLWHFGVGDAGFPRGIVVVGQVHVVVEIVVHDAPRSLGGALV